MLYLLFLLTCVLKKSLKTVANGAKAALIRGYYFKTSSTFKTFSSSEKYILSTKVKHQKKFAVRLSNYTNGKEKQK